MAKFQGSALYAYNNARFKEDDWLGIEGIMQGSKKKEPISAGRFGTGFNSVYHITGKVKCAKLMHHILKAHRVLNSVSTPPCPSLTFTLTLPLLSSKSAFSQPSNQRM